MELQQLSRLKASLVKAPIERVLEIEGIVRALIERRAAEANLAKRTTATMDARRCPHCAISGAMLHGKDKNGRQRFRCMNADCRRTYNILTGTPMARARKPEKWTQYLGCMSDHLSLRKIIERHVTINLRTAFRWRHRFLKAAQDHNAALLSGVIEADETYFVQSFKGSRGWKLGKPPAARAARPSGWGATLPGLSHQQVPVLTALDNAGAVYEAVLPSRAAIEPVLDGRIAAGSVLCSDGLKAYVKAAVKAGAEHRRVEIATTTYVTKMVGRPRRRGGSVSATSTLTMDGSRRSSTCVALAWQPSISAVTSRGTGRLAATDLPGRCCWITRSPNNKPQLQKRRPSSSRAPRFSWRSRHPSSCQYRQRPCRSRS